ncbi:MAG TPA: multifunctional oxoglutarate decarboxylase/oxoglutarate dehydrogenase thiamine pyrophosphate-binding subunit/dihydrolipoyllysine-residue succinyltransferase subunit [Solirubrobacteraceae bacterium]|jgi:2-oxoglutarate decarboxylase|nr:multifunctional oxoglutarate decarboxylase/oxoglutarate dehydrogenase thiamine pyrophosphate-binding subunit/dihydrolipoyllysine-residue succinyltransferase subunit [Solirubrobacteraceae bacterium]
MATSTPAVQTIDVVTPAAGESVTEGTILEWRVKVGDPIKLDDTIVEVSTDKVDLELPSPATGVVSEILVEEGDTVTVGQVIARISVGGDGTTPSAPSGDGNGQASAGNGAATGAPAPSATAPSTPAPGATAPNTSTPAADVKASPVAARAAVAEGVDLAQVAGSGPDGRITKSDVLSAASGAGSTSGNGSSVASANGAASTQPLRGGAAALVRYMEESRSIPTATSFRTLTVTVLDTRRRELKAAGRKVSFTHLIAYAIARAGEDMPVMANHFAEIDGKPHRVLDGTVNLGLAVDVEKKDGSRTLMVPVIRDAGRLRFDEFLSAYDALVEKARTNTLTADDLTGGNVTLTNPGGIGTAASVPRLMGGQGTIVATGSIGYPVGLEAIAASVGAEKVMTMTSTYDHRIIQGAESGRFLGLIEGYLHGENGFYEDVFAALGVELGPQPGAPVPTGVTSVARPAPASDGAGQTGAQPAGEEMLQAVQAASTIVARVRSHGHLAAHLDPLGTEPEGDPGLDPEALGLTPELQARLPARIFQVYVTGATLADALEHLRDTYCGTIAYEVEHIASHRQRVWLREHIESGKFRQELTNDERRTLLKRLIEVDALERFMHKAYLGQHQFSIEGLDMTVPMLDELIQLSAAHGGQEVVVGMAHRGRLNVLAHNLGRAYDTIFAEFEGASTLEAVTTIPQGGTGDVKYHHGTQGTYRLPDGGTIRVNLESNPSHLEYVSPVVEGATRAAQTSRKGPHAHQDTNAAVPITIHGDASFPGQGVVSETLNLQALDGYKVGGTVHLIMNNQVGFTTDPDDARSTRWASDLAKGFDVPIIHVNADDVPACINAVRLAFAFRQEFGHDVLIDLIGYRRFGHNESDEPAYTQPEMYAKIKSKKRIWDLWAERLIAEGVITKDEVERQSQEVWDNLTLLHQRLKAKIAAAVEHEGKQITGEYQLDRSPSPDVETAVPAARLRELGEQLLRVPEGFTVHPKLVKQLDRRREALAEGASEEKNIDWAHGEALAFASLLTEGTPLRLTGQDTERGTFSQRHMVLHDAKTGQTVCPIQSLPDALAPLELHNSPLSELACMGFEYGYSQEAPETLVLWEAQFGDFVNSAQVIVDQFITSGLAKWGQTSRLTLLLPHGYEGSGPEHSSARLERFLRAAAEGNIRVASPTTPAQYFHLLRRQARIAKQRPLIVMTPKSLLRLPQAASAIADMAEDTRFHPVLAEPGVAEEQVTRLVLCTGKIYYDLVGHPERAAHTGLAVGRVELLYPFPERQILELMDRYPNLNEILWVQEEPRNMGARAHMFPRLMQIMPQEMHFGYVGRPERASPGEGYPAAHIDEQNRIVTTAIDLRQPISQYPKKTPGER